MELTNFYQVMPGKNCGICGYGSCNTFARHVLFKKEDLKKCVWLSPTDIPCLNEVRPARTRVEETAFIQPCITDSGMVMAEIYLAPREVDYGYLDPGFCEFLYTYSNFKSVKCSQSLGIARIEYEGKEILISQTGKVVVRQAKTEEDAFAVCDLVRRIVSGAVICSCLATALEAVSGMCTCECEIEGPSKREKELYTSFEEYERSVLAAFSHTGLHNLDTAVLKVKAVDLLAHNEGGLILYALAHHLSFIRDAADAAQPQDKADENTINIIRKAFKGKHALEDYHHLLTYFNRDSDPFSRELYKAAFHARCIGEIKNRFFT
jgi:ArsR family metal-binding transcriptional regulator